MKAALWRVVVDPVEIPTETEGGVALPEDVVKQLGYLRHVGTVVDVGPLSYHGEKFIGPNNKHFAACKRGDVVVYGMHSGQDVYEKDGENIRHYKVLNDDEILGTLESVDSVVTQF